MIINSLHYVIREDVHNTCVDLLLLDLFGAPITSSNNVHNCSIFVKKEERKNALFITMRLYEV